jgi:hypothetical protein
VELIANGAVRSDESFSHEKAGGQTLADRDDDDMWIHGSDDLLDVRKCAFIPCIPAHILSLDICPPSLLYQEVSSRSNYCETPSSQSHSLVH